MGCIQAQRCHTNTCPTGVTTQDPRRARALDVGDKTVRVRRLQEATVASALQIMASMGGTDPARLRPHMLHRRIDPYTERSCAELYEWLLPGQLLAEPPVSWAADWNAADPDRFTV
ncbi:glutamate synthase-related protein [Streptomyces sp. NPDC091376]|uniref:glutamate synthase-related protein n=1 Tax=Streptomyces sp. NPDC091376 TaxID=3365994 RepID=UPI0037F5C8A5